jgi:hypothetical protein
MIRLVKSRRTSGGGTGGTYGRREKCTWFWWGNMKERDDLNRVVNGRIILKWILERWVERVWTGVIWLRIRTSGGLL